MILFWVAIFFAASAFPAGMVISMCALSRSRRREAKRQARIWKGVLK